MSESGNHRAALSHIRVLDMSRVLAGPWCGQVLADLGAEVIKIERPGAGDETRSWGPPYLKDAHGVDTRESAYFLGCNRGKQSVTVDIAKPAGQALVRKLAARSDVLIENYKAGDLARYGLDYAQLTRDNPQLIYCSITGFGQTGPMREAAGYDFSIQAIGGLMSVTGERDDLPGGGPQKVGVAVADIMTGMYAATAILAALAHRAHSGRGQYIDMALLDVQVAMLANISMNYLVTGRAPTRLGNAHPNIAPYQVFEAADGEFVLAIGNDGQFARFCEAAGCELHRDERFVTNADRVRNREALTTRLTALLRERRVDEWVALLTPIGVPIGPINNLERVFAHPQVQHRGMRLDLPHPAGLAPSVANPIRLSGTPVRYGAAPPTLGQHTNDVLHSLGLSEDDIAQLAAAGVI